MLQVPNQSNVHNLNNVRHEASRYFRNKKKEYLKAKIDKLETNSKIKKYQRLVYGISDIKPRTNIVQDEKDDFCY